MPPLLQDQKQDVIDRILQALSNLSQAQTDTLALIVVIVFLFVVAFIVFAGLYIYRSTRSKIVIPSQDPAVPPRVVGEREFMGVFINMTMDRIKSFSEQNERLDERLKESQANAAKIIPAVEQLLAQVSKGATAADVASLSSNIDTRIEQMKSSREALNTTMSAIQASEDDILKKVDRILTELDTMGKQIVDVKVELHGLAAQIVKDQAQRAKEKETPNEIVPVAPVVEHQPVPPVVGTTANPGAGQGTPAVPADHGADSGSTVVQSPAVAAGGHPVVAADPGGDLRSVGTAGPVLRATEGGPSGNVPEATGGGTA